ncbi:alpha/beta hydrolase [Pontibacillus sp. HMF3514]|uniref:alpha/beta family hydrolase n=1 Tax=Pontibacillus sp. HMF3514 TaxID=2692425 RepID=UPI0013204300|nr:alpha/beta hydrolase [Pontibacillus sp. HMF3514]QHE52709.1 alpha/beta hydrolase [Pontibacillus sp. HMF3514]
MKVEEKIITVNERNIPYTHIQNDSRKVCFMFSGAGYTYDKPLLYYSTMVALENHFDVVHIHYSYTEKELRQTFEQFAELIVGDVKPVVSKVLSKYKYEETIFIGKSLGTIPIIQEFLKDNSFTTSKMVLLTPLLKRQQLFESLSKSKGDIFIAIGKQDPHYIPEKINKLRSIPSIHLQELEGANHSLDIEGFHTSESLSCLSLTMDSLNHFLREE